MTDVQNSHQKKLDLAQDIADAEISRTLRKAKVSAIFRYVILIIVGLMMLYPLLWMFSAAFKPNNEIFTTLGLWPEHPTRDGF
ncbi:TPA: carbohydrate ABC transporter permease, partial [Yersinia enterocolitica]